MIPISFCTIWYSVRGPLTHIATVVFIFLGAFPAFGLVFDSISKIFGSDKPNRLEVRPRDKLLVQRLSRTVVVVVSFSAAR